MNTNQNTQFIDIFKTGLKITPRTLSIKTLLSDRNLRRINYRPYYQRNFVWDIEKQSFFIESVLLGTEIPPLILFKSGTNTEVIDGRQRFETLKRFKENDFSLSEKGLMELKALSKESFNKFDDDLKAIFLDSNIRVFEFEVITPIYSQLEDKIKKEIFRRYNSGITPLTSVEVDSAKYDQDPFSENIEVRLRTDQDLYDGISHCFFPSEKNDADMIGKMVDFFRKTYVLTKIPIKKYASGGNRNELFDLLYNTTSYDEINMDEFLRPYYQIISLYKKLVSDNETFLKRKLVYEALLWGIQILNNENALFDDVSKYDEIKEHYLSSLEKYSDDNSFYYSNIIERFSDTANFLTSIYGVNFDMYLKNNNFNSEIKQLRQGDDEAKSAMHLLEGLRINKPSPISKPVEEILSDVITQKYLVRPSYQRQEKVNEQKASAIIESILLGVSLPPIFIYKKENGIKEVIDGQQRLLSMIAFVGKQYRDENDKLVYSKNNNFKLKKLKILTELNGKSFSDLSDTDKDKILDFVIDEIIIEQSININFDPTDLFIRLNQKPYPIQQNSFEMWNSTVDKDVIEAIKNVSRKYFNWFFIRECPDLEHRTDKMENEELITLLSYIDYSMDKGSYEKVLGTFKRIDRITCRIKDKNSLSEYLMHLEDSVTEKEAFLKYVRKTDDKICDFAKLFDEDLSKDTLNNFFNLKQTKIFRRSNQDFYIVWILLHNRVVTDNNKNSIKNMIKEILGELRNIREKNIDDIYYENFVKKLNDSIV
ncbi:MAG: DUF262 domain-containing protein [Bacilli bacterium]|nr:DUF262 domain-containing protein [Bacilli bacterium]